MTPVEIVQSATSILFASLTSWAQGIGSGIQESITAMFFTGTGENQTLSLYAVLVLVFAGFAISAGITRLVFTWLGNLGGR